MKKVNYLMSSALLGGYRLTIGAHSVKPAFIGRGFDYYLHGNLIASIDGDGVLTVNNCGWETPTTKNALNSVLPSGWFIFQKNYTWFISTPGGVESFPFNCPYRVGVVK